MMREIERERRKLDHQRRNGMGMIYPTFDLSVCLIVQHASQISREGESQEDHNIVNKQKAQNYVERRKS